LIVIESLQGKCGGIQPVFNVYREGAWFGPNIAGPNTSCI
jgi:hypothetical protein